MTLFRTLTRRSVAFALTAAVLALVNSCKKDEELNCDDYFLGFAAQDGATYKPLYSANGKLSSIESSGDFGTSVSTYSYDNDQQLNTVAYDDVVDNFTFDDGELKAVDRTIDGSRQDSITLEYDEHGRVKREEFYNRLEIPPVLIRYRKYQYEDENEIIVKLYTASPDDPEDFDLTATLTYVTDNNPLPYPAEYYYESVAFGNVVLVHNTISVDVTDVPFQSSTSYLLQYNADGYPTRVAWPDGTITYSYKCTPPQQ